MWKRFPYVNLVFETLREIWWVQFDDIRAKFFFLGKGKCQIVTHNLLHFQKSHKDKISYLIINHWMSQLLEIYALIWSMLTLWLHDKSYVQIKIILFKLDIVNVLPLLLYYYVFYHHCLNMNFQKNKMSSCEIIVLLWSNINNKINFIIGHLTTKLG